MPKSNVKSSNKKSYEVTYRVVGDMDSLTPDQIKQLALRYIRTAARAAVVSAINVAEPAVISHAKMLQEFVNSGIMTQEQGTSFFTAKGWPISVPTQYEVPITDLIPEDSGRGKKAANIFEFGGEDDSDESEAETETPEATQ